MSWRSWFSRATREECRWVMLNHAHPLWEVRPAPDVAAFLRALLSLFPSGMFLYLEGGALPEPLDTYLRARCSSDKPKIPRGTAWPRARFWHVPLTKGNLEGLAEIAGQYVPSQVTDHVHVHDGREVHLEWYDAFTDPMFVSGAVPEERIAKFCREIGVTYTTAGIG